ncbi:BON domain-containing protein [Dyella monticola]|uniref:Osmotically-inducible protein Y n=1 Tax=Dyella monticola TaxID=1927958 RepID=A0A370X389_9GAMM|nr:BON domain-containing protein [Dyella monticola]RDS82858.1 BON domain-containing protein [Dyella monticola]
MRNVSYLRKSLIAAGVMMAFATVPFSLMAQSTSPSSMPQQQQQPSTMQQQPSSMQSTSNSNQDMPGKVDDSWITTKVKSKFAAAKGVKAHDITVSTTDGVVTLTGTATSQTEKKHAIHLAKGVKGVKSVDASGLTVNSSSSSTPSSSGGSSGT